MPQRLVLQELYLPQIAEITDEIDSACSQIFLVNRRNAPAIGFGKRKTAPLDGIRDRILQRAAMETNCSPVTELLQRWSQGDKAALNSLMPLIYDDLRRVASFYLQQESSARTLQSTALVHEVYLRLCGQQDPEWNGRAHFFAVAAKMIRRILVDHAREKSAAKRGGEMQPQPLEESLMIPVQPNLDLVRLNDAMEELAAFDLRKSKVVEMRFFAGLNARGIAAVLGITEATVRRDWNIARAWLYRRLRGELP